MSPRIGSQKGSDKTRVGTCRNVGTPSRRKTTKTVDNYISAGQREKTIHFSDMREAEPARGFRQVPTFRQIRRQHETVVATYSATRTPHHRRPESKPMTVTVEPTDPVEAHDHYRHLFRSCIPDDRWASMLADYAARYEAAALRAATAETALHEARVRLRNITGAITRGDHTQARHLARRYTTETR